VAEQITTAAELDALPVGSVVLDSDEAPWLAEGWRGRWGRRSLYWGNVSDAPMRSVDLVLAYGPLTVVHVPGRDLLAEAEARGARKAAERVDAEAVWQEHQAAHDGPQIDARVLAQRVRQVAADIIARSEQAGGDRG